MGTWLLVCRCWRSMWYQNFQYGKVHLRTNSLLQFSWICQYWLNKPTTLVYIDNTCEYIFNFLKRALLHRTPPIVLPSFSTSFWSKSLHCGNLRGRYHFHIYSRYFEPEFRSDKANATKNDTSWARQWAPWPWNWGQLRGQQHDGHSFQGSCSPSRPSPESLQALLTSRSTEHVPTLGKIRKPSISYSLLSLLASYSEWSKLNIKRRCFKYQVCTHNTKPG